MNIDPRRLIVLLFLTVAGCSVASSRHPVVAASTTFAAAEVIAGAKAEIDAANAAWLPGLRNRDAASITAAYADDGMFIAPDGTVTRGRDAITAMYASRFPRLREILAGDVVQDGIEAISPTVIYEWGHAWIDMAAARAGDPPVHSGGPYLTVWQRGADGHWRITRNIAL